MNSHAKGNVNYKTIMERDRKISDFNVTLIAGAVNRVVASDTHNTYVGSTHQLSQNIHVVR